MTADPTLAVTLKSFLNPPLIRPNADADPSPDHNSNVGFDFLHVNYAALNPSLLYRQLLPKHLQVEMSAVLGVVCDDAREAVAARELLRRQVCITLGPNLILV